MMETGFVKGQSDNLPKIDSFMVATFFANNPHFTSVEMRGVKTLSAGRENYGDAAVGYVQVKRSGSVCVVKTKICPEHKVRAKNYSVEVEVDEATPKILRAECQDCAASAGGCKHSVAVVMWLHRRSEEPAPTDTVCYWKKSKLSGVGTSLKFLTTSSFGTPKQLPNDTITSGSFLEEFIQKGKKLGISSQLMKYYSEADDESVLGLHQLLCDFIKISDVSDCGSFLEFAKRRMTLEACDTACKATIEQSNSKLWFDLRYGRITASELYEAARCKTTSGTFVETVIGSRNIKETTPMKRGKLLEKKILGVLTKQLGIDFHSVGLLLTPDHAILGASPDAISEIYVVEIKCPSKSKTMNNYFLDSEIKKKYRAQLQLQMYIFKKHKGIFCVADPQFETNEKIYILYDELDTEMTETLIESAEMFWKNNVFPILISSIKS